VKEFIDVYAFTQLTGAFSMMRGRFLKNFLQATMLPEDVRCGQCPKPADESGTYTHCKHCQNTKRTPIPFSEVWCR
jgi:hypothetical protein